MSAFDNVTGAIVRQLEQGVIPWDRPWKPAFSGPMSYATGEQFHGINQWLLPRPGYYITISKAIALAADFKGAKVHWIISCENRLVDTDEVDPATGEKRKTVRRRFRMYKELHLDDVRGLEPPRAPEEVPGADVAPDEWLEDAVRRYLDREKLTVVHKDCTQPYFDVVRSEVCLPSPSRFKEPEQYYAILFSVLAATTGTVSRLCRRTPLSPQDRSREDLICEIAAVMLLHCFELDTASVFVNRSAYIRRIIDTLQEDSRAIYYCARRAEAAARFILDAADPFAFRDSESERSSDTSDSD